jgi:serine/threonine protein kinase
VGAHECPNCAGDPLLDGRYRLDRELAGDSVGSSYRATRIEDGLLVRARSCLIRRLDSADLETDRSDRLARLRKLEHACLPRRLDEFVLGEASLATQWLIHENISGHTLADAMSAAAHHRIEPARLLPALRELAELLAYLHGQPTPVVHGALTPKLILLRSSDRGACLLDLALASEAVHGCGSRGLADSLAYSAPEQLYDAASSASDVWSLGAIAVVALSGVSITKLRDASSKLRWRERVGVELDDDLTHLLERMLDADPTTRISAAELAAALAKLPVPEPRRPVRHHPWTPVDQLAEPAQADARGRLAHRPPRHEPKPVLPRTADPALPARNGKPDAPVRRPEELSRELSQAHQIAFTMREQQRSQLFVARLLVALVTAAIAGLVTYIAMTLG